MPNGTWCPPPRHGRPRPMAAPRGGGQDETMLFAIVLALTIGCIAFILARESQGVPRPAGLRGWIRARGWGLLLLPVAMAAAVMAGGAHGLIPAELGIAVLAVVFAPKLAARLVPFGVLGLAIFGFHLAKLYRDGFTNQVQYLFVHAGPDTWDGGAAPVLVEAGVLFVTGLWLLLRLDAPGAGLVRALAARWLDRGRGGISAAHALLLIPVVGLAMQLPGPGNWFGIQAVDGLDVALIDLTVATAALVLIFRSRAWAATLAEAGLLVLGARVRVRRLRPAQQPGARPALDRRPARLPPAGPGPVAGAADDAPSPGRPGRPGARGPGPAADQAGAAADPDPLRRGGHRGRRTAPHRTRPARRGASPAGRAGYEPAGGRAAVPDQPGGGPRAGGRGQAVLLPGPDRAARPGARHLPAGARRPRAGRRDPRPGAGRAAARRARHRPRQHDRAARRLGRLLLGGRGAHQRDQARRRP